MFGELRNAEKAVQTGVRCAQRVSSIVVRVQALIQQTQQFNPDITRDQIRVAVMGSDIVVLDLPDALMACLGLTVSPNVAKLQKIAKQAELLIDKLLDETATASPSPSSPLPSVAPQQSVEDFLAFANGTGIEPIENLDAQGRADLAQLWATAGSTCGTAIYDVVNKAQDFIKKNKQVDPRVTKETLKLALTSSQLIVTDLPRAALTCTDPTADNSSYVQRDQIVQVALSIIDKLVDATETKDGKQLALPDYLMTVSSMGLGMLEQFDPTRLANLANKFLQPVCDPTSFLGEIDDGPLDQALGLHTMQGAFEGSAGTWRHNGDGLVHIVLESVDPEEDATVVIHSGGQKIDEVEVPALTTVHWTKNVTDLADKALYLDRWRNGFLHIPTTSGGSLVMWVPRSNGGGHVDLTAKLNAP